MIVVYKSGRKHSDADCLSRAPVEPATGWAKDSDDDYPFLGAVIVNVIAGLLRDDQKLRAFIDHLEGHSTCVKVLPYVTFVSSMVVQGTTGITPFLLVHGRMAMSMLGGMLPHYLEDDGTNDAQLVTQRIG